MKNWIRFAIACIAVGVVGMSIFGFEFGDDRIAYEKQFAFSKAGTHSLVMRTDSSTYIQFVPSEDEQISVLFKGKWHQDAINRIEQTALEGSTLTIDTSAKDSFQFLSFNLDFSDNRIEVRIPSDKTLDELVLDNISSNNDITGVQARHVSISSTSGDFNLEDVQANQLTVNLSSGNLDMKDVTAKDSASFDMISGEIELENLTSSRIAVKLQSGSIEAAGIQGQLEVKSTSGDIEIEDLHGDASIEVQSGNVEVSQSVRGNLDIRAVSGDVDVIAAHDFAGFYDVQAVSGSVHAPESPRTGTELIKVRTTSGNIQIEQP